MIENTVHFMAPDGNDVVVPPGRYAVESPANAQLRFVPDTGGESRTVVAASRQYDLAYSAPVALSMPYEDGMHHVMLVFPDGTVLDAVGSPSEVITRGFPTPIPQGLLAQALNAKATKITPASPFTGNIDKAKVRIPVNLTIQPGPQVSGFQDCGSVLNAGYVDSVFAQQIIFSQPHNTPAGAENLGTTTTTPPGTPYGRMNPGARLQYRCAIGMVTVTPSTGSLGKGDHVQLKVISTVYGQSAWVQDRYDLAPAANGPLTFSKVIMASAYAGDKPQFVQQNEQQAVGNMSTGAMLGIEALVNGVSAAKLPCRYKATANGYGAGTVVCSSGLPYPPEP